MSELWTFGDSAMITISFNLTKDDVLALACHYYATSSTVRKNRMAAQVSAFLIFASAGLLVICSSDRLRPVGVILLVCAGLSAACVPSWYRSNLRKTAEKMIEESSYRKAFGSYTLALSEEGLASTSPIGAGNYTWGAIDRVALTPEHLFIFLVGHQGFAIPRSQVSDSKIQEVKAFAESHVRSAELGAGPDGGLAAPPGSSGVTQGPPSVI
jgi:hypothetical protein